MMQWAVRSEEVWLVMALNTNACTVGGGGGGGGGNLFGENQLTWTSRLATYESLYFRTVLSLHLKHNHLQVLIQYDWN